MKDIEDILKEMTITKPLEYKEPFINPKEPEFNDFDFQVINRLFARLSLLCPAFKQAWPSQDDYDNAKKEWVRAFKLAKMFDVEKIKFGIETYSLLDKAFVPSVGQFIEICKKPYKPEYHQYYKKLGDSTYTKEELEKHKEIIKPEYKDIKSPKSACAAMKELLK